VNDDQFGFDQVKEANCGDCVRPLSLEDKRGHTCGPMDEVEQPEDAPKPSVRRKEKDALGRLMLACCCGERFTTSHYLKQHQRV